MAPQRKPEWIKAGERLYQRRIGLGLTQVEFAERIGVAPNTVARWERGEIGMHPSREAHIELLFQDKKK
jgi:transcriptional regulator with XRE-family HTH domain